jgi:hypothetical protein
MLPVNCQIALSCGRLRLLLLIAQSFVVQDDKEESSPSLMILQVANIHPQSNLDIN